MFIFAEVFVDSDRGAFAIAYAVDNQAWAEDAIAAGEDSSSRSHQRFWIDGDQAAGREFDLIFEREEVEARGLADGHDDGVALDLAFAALEERRIEAFVLIENPFCFERFECN